MERSYGVDLFRIIAAFFVILLHIMGQGGVLDAIYTEGVKFWAAWFIEIATYCAVNCFALITGYLMWNRTVKTKSVFNLWFTSLFYSVLITALFFIFLPETRDIKQALRAFFPVTSSCWWYVTGYFLLLLFIPFLNAAVKSLPKRTFDKFLVGILVSVCFFDGLSFMNSFSVNGGYSGIWLMILYLFGAYIGKFGIEKKITAWQSFLGFLAVIILTLEGKMVIRKLTKTVSLSVDLEKVLISYTSVTIVFAAIFLLLFCLNVKQNKFSQTLVSIFAPVTFGVYLIHVHPLVFGKLLYSAFSSFAEKTTVGMVLWVLAAALAIFMICAGIESVRILLFKLMKVNKLCELLGEKVSETYDKIFLKNKNV